MLRRLHPPTTRYVDYNWNSWLRPEMLQVLMLVYMAYLRTGTFFGMPIPLVRSHCPSPPLYHASSEPDRL